MPKKKFIYLVESDLKSGSGKCAWNHLVLLQKNSDLYPIVVTQHYNDLNYACSENGIENYALHYARTCSLGGGLFGWLIAFFARPFLNYLAYKNLKKKVNLKEIQFIHTNNSTIDFGAYLYKKTGRPHSWHIREFLVFNGVHPPIIYKLPKYIGKNASIVITISNTLKDFCTKQRIPNQKIQTIYDGIPLPDIKSAVPNKAISSTRIVCVSNFAPPKGQDVVIDALTKLPPELLKRISVDFYGEQYDIQFCKKLHNEIQKHHLENNVKFCGFSDDIRSKLSNYDIGLQPSHTEGFSLVTVEYMMAGLCIIANGDTAVGELIEHKKNGLLIHDNDSTQMAKWIEHCIENKYRIRTLGEAAQKRAFENFTLEQNFNRILNLYNKIIQQ